MHKSTTTLQVSTSTHLSTKYCAIQFQTLESGSLHDQHALNFSPTKT